MLQGLLVLIVNMTFTLKVYNIIQGDMKTTPEDNFVEHAWEWDLCVVGKMSKALWEQCLPNDVQYFTEGTEKLVLK